jgi:hypothetical protein
MVSSKTSVILAITLFLMALLYVVNDVGFDTTARIVSTGRAERSVEPFKMWVNLILLLFVGSVGAALVVNATLGNQEERPPLERVPFDEMGKEWKTVKVKKLGKKK